MHAAADGLLATRIESEVHNLWQYLFTGLDHWTGLLDWTTGLTVDLKIPQLDEHGVSICKA